MNHPAGGGHHDAGNRWSASTAPDAVKEGKSRVGAAALGRAPENARDSPLRGLGYAWRSSAHQPLTWPGHEFWLDFGGASEGTPGDKRLDGKGSGLVK